MGQQRRSDARAGAQAALDGAAPRLTTSGSGPAVLQLRAQTYGRPPAELTCEVELYGRPSRIRRAARGAAAMLAGAVLSLPFPGWHFVAVPGFLIAAVTVAIRRLKQDYAVTAVHGPCPACAQRIRLVLPAATRFPCTTSCPSCRSFLKLADLR